MTYGQAYLSGWKETFNFSGRASRRQFWTFFLTNVLIAAAPLAAWCLATSVNPQYGILSFVVIPFAALWLLLMTLPLLAISRLIRKNVQNCCRLARPLKLKVSFQPLKYACP